MPAALPAVLVHYAVAAHNFVTLGVVSICANLGVLQGYLDAASPYLRVMLIRGVCVQVFVGLVG